MKTTSGSNLHPDDKVHVLNAYVHRFTGEHKPSWAHKPWKGNQAYPVQFANDSEWLENTLFAVRKDGRLNMGNRFCYSSPTWPNNPELRVKITS